MAGPRDGETLDTVATVDPAREAFARLVEQHRGVLLKVARAYCWSADDRDDLVQDILAQMWRAYPRYDSGRPFSTWMYRVALNVAISWLRAAGPRRRATVPLDQDVHDLAASAPDAVAAERQRALMCVIRALDPMNRALLLLYLDDRSHREIAGILGLTETNVATKLHRLRQRIRAELAAFA